MDKESIDRIRKLCEQEGFNPVPDWIAENILDHRVTLALANSREYRPDDNVGYYEN